MLIIRAQPTESLHDYSPVRCSLRLYHHQFRDEFGEEMQAVFEETVASSEKGPKVSLFLREMRDFPGSLLDAYMNNWLRGGNPSMSDEYISSSTRWQAFLGILPFLAFGISSMIGKADYVYINLQECKASITMQIVMFCL